MDKDGLTALTLRSTRTKNIENTPDKYRMIVLNRTNRISNEWSDYSNERIMCVGLGETIDEETAIASKTDILAITNYLRDKNG